MGIELVKQEDPNGCLVACTAMIFGWDYQTAFHKLRRYGVFRPAELKRSGINHYELDHFLADHGYAIQRLNWRNVTTTRDYWPVTPWAKIHLCSVIPHGSREVEMSHGVIMLADGSILDPNRDTPQTLAHYDHVCSIAALHTAPRIGDQHE